MATHVAADAAADAAESRADPAVVAMAVEEILASGRGTIRDVSQTLVMQGGFADRHADDLNVEIEG